MFSQVLKTHTKEVLYEKYRTEKLLARRATRNISEDERQRLLEGTLIFLITHLFLKIYFLPRSRIVIYSYFIVYFFIIPFNIPCNSLIPT